MLLSQIAADGKVEQTAQHFTDGVKALEDAGKLLATWANRASHEDIETADAKQLIDTCKTALAQLTCTTCGKDVWLSAAASTEWVQCTCGDVR